MKLAKTIRFDASDTHVFEKAADEGNWAVSGGFSFAHCREAELTGKVKQAFANGFLSIPDFGYSTFVSVSTASAGDLDWLETVLAAHLSSHYGAPSEDAARAAAREEIAFMADICSEHKPGTLLSLARHMDKKGIKEQFRAHAKAVSCATQTLWQIVDDEL